MTMTTRVLLATCIIMIDLVAFFIPLSAVLVAYVIVFNPPWVKDVINRLEPPTG